MDKIIKQSREIENFKKEGASAAVYDTHDDTSREGTSRITTANPKRRQKSV